MRKAAIGAAILIVVLLGALALGPRFVDLDRYRAEIAAKATILVGHEVTLAGPAKLSLLPSPSAILRDVRIANPPGGSTPDLARADAVEAKLAFWPLLTGRYEVTSLRLIAPRVTLERRENGQANWRPAAPPVPDSASATGMAGLDGQRAANALRIDRMTIEDGRLTYRRGATLQVLEHIDATLTGDAVSGPVHVAGRLAAEGRSIEFFADIGRFTAERLPVALSLKAIAAASLTLNGDWMRAEGSPRFDGKLALASDDPGALSSMLGGGEAPALLTERFAASSDVSASSDGVVLDRLTIELGEIRGRGSLHATFGPKLDLALRLTVDKLDLDRWLAERETAASPGPAPPAAAGKAPTTKLPVVSPGGTLGIALPEGITASIDLSVDGMIWRKSVVRQARLEAALADGKISVKRVGALLPGASDLKASGILDNLATLPRFSGSIEATTDNLRGLMTWLGAPIDGVPPDRLGRASLATKLSIDGDIAEARDIALSFDATQLSGAATIALRHRLGFGARLALDQLNLDAYLPANLAAATPQSATSAGAPAADAQAPGPTVRLLQTFDANFDIAADSVIWRSQPIRHLHLIGTLANRDVTVRELSIGDLGGASGKLSGFLEGVGDSDAKSEMAFDMRGPELGRVLSVAAPGLAAGENYGAFALGGEIQGEGWKLVVDGDLEALGGKLHVAGDLPTAPGATIDAALDAPSFNRLIRVASPAYRPRGGELGAVKLQGRLERTNEGVALDHFSLEIGEMSLAGTARLALAQRPMLAADLTLGDVAIDRFLPMRQTAALEPRRLPAGVVLAQAQAAGAPPAGGGGGQWSRIPLELGFLKSFDADLNLAGKSLAWGSWRLTEVSARLALKDALLQCPTLGGKLFGGTLAASGRLNVADLPSLDLKLALSRADLKQSLAGAGVSLLEGSFDLDSTLATVGASPADLIAHLEGEAALKGEGTINGINLPAANQQLSQLNRPGDLLGLLRAGSGGATRFSSLGGDFRVTDGVAVSRNLDLVAEGGEGKGVAILDFPNWTIASRTEFRLTDVPGAPPLGVVLDGPLDQPRKVFDINALEKFLVARMTERAQHPSATDDKDATTSSDGKPAKPSQMLRDLLKGLKTRP